MLHPRRLVRAGMYGVRRSRGLPRVCCSKSTTCYRNTTPACQRSPLPEIRPLYLSGPDPRADAAVLICLGAEPSNLWAVDTSGVSESLKMLGTIKIPFKQAKVQDWVAQITFRDLIYLDWTGSIFSESWPLTLKTFMQNQLHLTNPSSSSSSASSLLTARRSMLITNVNIHTGNNVWSQFLPKASFGELTQTIQVLTLRDWIPWLLSFPHERFDATGDEYASLLEDTLENLLWKDLKSDASRFVLEACREAGASFSPPRTGRIQIFPGGKSGLLEASWHVGSSNWARLTPLASRNRSPFQCCWIHGTTALYHTIEVEESAHPCRYRCFSFCASPSRFCLLGRRTPLPAW
jgi:hypothetical protein